MMIDIAYPVKCIFLIIHMSFQRIELFLRTPMGDKGIIEEVELQVGLGRQEIGK